jgi:hypothetical protein
LIAAVSRLTNNTARLERQIRIITTSQLAKNRSLTRVFQLIRKMSVICQKTSKPRAGRPAATRLPMSESHGWLREWYGMTRARTLPELKSALAHHAMLFGNVMSAGTDGHIFYVYNAALHLPSCWRGALLL